MSDTINLLKRIINEDAIIPRIRAQDGRLNCELTEDNTEKPYRFTLTNLPEDSLVVNCEKFPKTDAFIRDENGMRCRADYIIFYGKEKIVVIIELKKSKDSSTKEHIINQLKGSKCIVDYCKSVGTEFLNRMSFLSGFECRYCCYINKVNNRSIKEMKDTQGKKPDQFKKISGSVVQFPKLIVDRNSNG